MEKEEKYIELYQTHWLYNAAVIGFLKSIKEIEKNIEVRDFIDNTGRVKLPLSIFENLEIEQRYFPKNNGDKIASIYRNAFFRNYLNTDDDVKGFPSYVKSLSHINENGEKCNCCGRKFSLPQEYLEKLKKRKLEKFLDRISMFNIVYSTEIAPSINEFPNAFWNLNNSLKICPICSFLLIHHQYPFIKLIDNSLLFINAPSFRLMYELNNLLTNLVKKEISSYKNLLAMTIVEFSIKTKIMLHTWASMDIEMVFIKRRAKEKPMIEFISLPYETIKLLSNKKIAELLSSIGEFRILNMVIDNKWKDLVELGYRLLKIAMKSNIGKEDRDFINKVFYSSGSLQSSVSIKQLANKLMKLYSLIEERTKNNKYGYING